MLKKLLLSITLLLTGVLTFAQQLPEKSSSLVTDYANMLPAMQRDQLEQKLVAFDDSTTTQIAVVIIKSVGDYDINDYALKLGRAWGIGHKDKNNGILILVAFNDRKVSIQTGYGAEGAVPDIITHQIIENDIKPNFKQGDYYAGLDAATNDLMKYMKGEYKAPKKSSKKDRAGAIGFVVIIVIVVLIIVFRNRGGGGGHIIDRRGGASPFWWFLGGTMLGRSSGGWGGFSNGGGGFGGGSGGGFGGFGGGSFGGGGSSGSW